VRIYCYFETEETLFIVMEYVEGETLLDFMNDLVTQGKSLSEAEAHFYFLQLVHALEFMHSNGIVHGGISLENVYLTDSHLVKLGHIRWVQLDDGPEQQQYKAPEMLRTDSLSPSVDSWSVGVLLYELVH
jgi:serine/threonine protein kinase